MITEVTRTARSGGDVTGAAAEGRGSAPAHRAGFRPRHGSVTPVTVVPLWDRYRTGVRG
ncbi:hypothetical protein EV578_102361 [Streptomyces sp. BK205]|nr:hypothetical protein EV578_102361 [Streptomyces sp. BK205]